MRAAEVLPATALLNVGESFYLVTDDAPAWDVSVLGGPVQQTALGLFESPPFSTLEGGKVYCKDNSNFPGTWTFTTMRQGQGWKTYTETYKQFIVLKSDQQYQVGKVYWLRMSSVSQRPFMPLPGGKKESSDLRFFMDSDNQRYHLLYVAS